MAAVANVAVKLDATGVVRQLKEIRSSSLGAADGFKTLTDRAKAVKSIVEAQQGGFAKASTIQGVFAAKVKNTEQAIRSQITALRQVQSQVQLGGALYQKAQQQIEQYERVLRQAKGATDGVGNSAQMSAGKLSGLRGAVAGLALQFTAAVSVVKVFTDSLNVAFARAAAEQKLKNFTDSAEEYSAALAIAADSSQKFGITQTEATQALGDVFSRLKGLGFGLKETAEIYQGFNTIAKQSGTTAEDASGAFLQLSQALGSGKLQGDELRSILERMPTLAQRIADSMGRSAAEIRNMGQSGELTSQVIYKALSEAAEAAGDLDGKLTEQQKTMMTLKQEADKLLYTLGQMFAPLVIEGAKQLANAVNFLGGVVHQMQEPLGFVNQLFLYLIANARTLAQITAAFGAAVVTFKAIGIATQVWAKATAALATAKKAAAAAAAVLQGILNPASLLKTAAAVAAGAAVYFGLGKMIDGAANEAKRLGDEQQGASEKAKGLVNNFSALPPTIVDAKEQTKKLVAEIEKGRVAVKAMENDLNFATQALQQQADQASKLASLQVKLNGLAVQRLQNLLKEEKNLDRQLYIIEQIRKIKVSTAEIEYKQAKAQIKLQKQLAKLEVDRQYLKLKNLEIDYRVAKAKGQEVAGFIEAYRAGEQAVDLARRNLGFVEDTADMQLRVAKETFKAAVQAANMEANTAASAARMRALEQAARDTAGATNAAADAAERMNRATEWKVLSKEKDPTKAGYRAERINEKGRRETVTTYQKSPGLRIFGEGGYVNKPTNALIGERNEGEYIVPASKVGGFIENYLSGARGRNAVPEAGDTRAINIQTGPVMQQDGKRYVTLSDMEGALQVLASSLLNNGRTAGGRRYQGV